jgi:hypothetical protein
LLVTPIPPERETSVIVIEGPIGPADVPRLCERVRGLPSQDLAARQIVCDVSALISVDLRCVDALA